jgi:hypothetical protein
LFDKVIPHEKAAFPPAGKMSLIKTFAGEGALQADPTAEYTGASVKLGKRNASSPATMAKAVMMRNT